MLKKIQDYAEARGPAAAVITAVLIFVFPTVAAFGWTLNLMWFSYIALAGMAVFFYLLWWVTRRDLDRRQAENRRLLVALRRLRQQVIGDHQKKLVQTYWKELIHISPDGDTQQEVTKTFRVGNEAIHFLYFKCGGSKLQAKEKKKFSVSANMEGTDLICYVSEWESIDEEYELATVWAHLPFPMENQDVTVTWVYEWPRLLPDIAQPGGSEGFWWELVTPIPEEGMRLEFEYTFEKGLGVTAPFRFTPSRYRGQLRQSAVNGNWVVGGEEQIFDMNDRIGFQLSRTD